MAGCCGASRPEATRSDPVVLGDPNGAPARYFKVLSTLAGLAYGQKAWVTGGDVDNMILAGYLKPLADPDP